MHAKLSLHLPQIEQYATRDDAIELIMNAFGADASVETHLYTGARHGFGFSPPHPSYDLAAARLANTRAALFLQEAMARG